MESKIKHIPLGLFCLSATKLLILGASYVDAPILLILALLAAIYETKSQDKEIKKLREEIQLLKNTDVDTAKSISEIKTYLGGIKLGQNVRANLSGNR